ncbi:MAG: hypothetical protein M5R36_08095 [Deltaproteobacteria bacterium]|nr:hypothetical protein [Deltaproteobacteria bacterium]
MDGEGRVWTGYFDYDGVISPTTLSLVRWDDGEIAEVVPVGDTGITEFYKLFRFPDGRFGMTYHSGSDWLVEQTPEGDFTACSAETLYRAAVGGDGLMHTLWVGPGRLVRHSYGSCLSVSPFIDEIAGLAPFAFVANSGTAVDSAGTVHSAPILEGERLWHAVYDGSQLVFSSWGCPRDRRITGRQWRSIIWTDRMPSSAANRPVIFASS